MFELYYVTLKECKVEVIDRININKVVQVYNQKNMMYESQNINQKKWTWSIDIETRKSYYNNPGFITSSVIQELKPKTLYEF